jgi:ATP-dependent helicase/nuclease subunit B
MLVSIYGFSMRVVLGPFRPGLEDALAEEISQQKIGDPLAPLLVVVPSASMKERLKVLLAGERGHDFLNLYLLTFFQLSLRLFEELGGAPELRPSDDLFLEEALRQMIRRGHPAAAPFNELQQTAAGCAALWQTLRDLKDGLVDPARALEAVAEGHFGDDGEEKLAPLLSLYDAFLSRCREWRIGDYTDIDATVLGQIPSSAFLRRFQRIVYYGFYDLTQVQTDFFHAVARHHPTTLYFPLLRAAPGAWSFSERFYERHVRGLAQEETEAPSVARSRSASFFPVSLFAEEREETSLFLPPGLRCSVVSASGPRDEVLTVAKEILRLVSEQRMAFDDIGVVARTLAPYGHWIREVFAEHRIPLRGSLEEPLVQSPLAKASLLLVHLHAKSYLRSTFIDLVSSPFFNLVPFAPGAIKPRPDLWDFLTRRLGITKGPAKWRRVEAHHGKDLVLAEREEDGKEQVTLRGSAAQLGILWRLFTVLYRDLSALPAEASWSDYASAWTRLFEKYLGIGATDRSLSPVEASVSESISSTLEKLARLDAVSPAVTLGDFAEAYRRWLERTSISVTDPNLRGVAVLDAMGARGLPFRALFILGLNEGAFPRTIREDAFLRDRHRRLFGTVLGSKVSEKLAGFDEEKLLFTLLVGAARERLYCFCQRADDNGRVLAPSWYLTELKRAMSRKGGLASPDEITVPRGIPDKAGVEFFQSLENFPPEELAIRLSLGGEDASAPVERFSLAPGLYRRGLSAMEVLEEPSGRIGAHDGRIGAVAGYHARLSRHGIAPTALERYALCPFQFFAVNLLGLGRLERPEDILYLEPAEIGRLCHATLRAVFGTLIERDDFDASLSDKELADILERALRDVCAAYEADNPPAFSLQWEVVKENLGQMLREILARDIAEIRQSGFRPAAVELEIKDSFPWDDPPALKGLPIRGRLDRIDVHHGEARCRVIDYKYRQGRNRATEDGNLLLGAIRGQRLQPPFYALLANRYARETVRLGADPATLAAFYFLAPNWKDGPLAISTFAADGWRGESGAQLRRTLSVLLDGIEKGRFFIRPGDYCGRCDVSEVCRKNHLPSAWRAERDPISRTHAELRRLTIAKRSPEGSSRSRPARGRKK